jgi:hypothetical protein
LCNFLHQSLRLIFYYYVVYLNSNFTPSMLSDFKKRVFSYAQYFFVGETKIYFEFPKIQQYFLLCLVANIVSVGETSFCKQDRSS